MSYRTSMLLHNGRSRASSVPDIVFGVARCQFVFNSITAGCFSSGDRQTPGRGWNGPHAHVNVTSSQNASTFINRHC